MAPMGHRPECKPQTRLPLGLQPRPLQFFCPSATPTPTPFHRPLLLHRLAALAGPLGICSDPGEHPRQHTPRTRPHAPAAGRAGQTQVRRHGRRGPVLPNPVTAQSWPGRPWSAAKGSGTPAFGGPSAGCQPLLPRGLLASPGSGPWASSPATCVRPPCWPQLPASLLLPAWAWPSAGAPSAV